MCSEMNDYVFGEAEERLLRIHFGEQAALRHESQRLRRVKRLDFHSSLNCDKMHCLND